MATADRLNRILGMIPFLLQNQGVPLQELAQEFQVHLGVDPGSLDGAVA